MAFSTKGIGRVVVVVYLIALHVAVILLAAEKMRHYSLSSATPPDSAVADPVATRSVPTPIVDPTPEPLPQEPHADGATAVTTPSPQPLAPQPGGLLIPVAGVGPDKLIDSFSDARSDGRVHDAIDIPAAAGTPVLAAADGEIVKFFDSEKGGITIYQLSLDRKFVYYYAHLQNRAADIRVGETVQAGRTIGFVGDTGNAGPGNFHLHFAITTVDDPKRYWEGTPVNPFPILRGETRLQ